jgi:hypothetical protein
MSTNGTIAIVCKRGNKLHMLCKQFILMTQIIHLYSINRGRKNSGVYQHPFGGEFFKGSKVSKLRGHSNDFLVVALDAHLTGNSTKINLVIMYRTKYKIKRRLPFYLLLSAILENLSKVVTLVVSRTQAYCSGLWVRSRNML